MVFGIISSVRFERRWHRVENSGRAVDWFVSLRPESDPSLESLRGAEFRAELLWVLDGEHISEPDQNQGK